MSWLLISKIALYFAIAFLTVFAAGFADAQTTRQLTSLAIAATLSGLVSIRAFVDRSFATEKGTPVEPAKLEGQAKP